MPMHISPTIDTDLGRMATMFPQISPIGKSLPPATQSDILGILQREQDRAVALLSSSPLLASLFVSYANQAATLECTTPSTETEEWKALEKMISALQEELDKLKPENLKMTESLETATASLEAFRSQVASLKETNAQQKQVIDSLRADLFESKLEHTLLVEDSNAERDILKCTISDLEAQRAEMKDTIVRQQLRISKLERQASNDLSGPPPFGATAAKMEKNEQEAKDSSCGEVKRKSRKRPSSVVYPDFGPTLGKNSGPPKVTSSVSQEQANKVWGGFKVYEPPTRRIITSSPVMGGTSGTRKIPSLGSPRSSDTDGLCTPPMKKGEDIDTMSGPSPIATPLMSVRLPAPPVNARFPDRELGLSSPSSDDSLDLPPPPRAEPWSFSKSTLDAPKDFAKEVLTTPKRLPAHPVSPKVATPAPAPAKSEPENRKKPLFSRLSEIQKASAIDTAKILPGSPNTAGPENIPESAIEIKQVPSPGGLTDSITDKEAGNAQDGTLGRGGVGKFEVFGSSSKDSLPIEEKGQVASASQTLCVDPHNADVIPFGAGRKNNRKNKGSLGTTQPGTVQQERRQLGWF